MAVSELIQKNHDLDQVLDCVIMSMYSSRAAPLIVVVALCTTKIPRSASVVSE
jgi:hypothetical protein